MRAAKREGLRGIRSQDDKVSAFLPLARIDQEYRTAARVVEA